MYFLYQRASYKTSNTTGKTNSSKLRNPAYTSHHQEVRRRHWSVNTVTIQCSNFAGSIPLGIAASLLPLSTTPIHARRLTYNFARAHTGIPGASYSRSTIPTVIPSSTMYRNTTTKRDIVGFSISPVDVCRSVSSL